MQILIKKILSILLCITIMCPLCTLAAPEDEMFFEIAEYNEAVQFLTAFKIMTMESPFLDTDDWTITRGEFIQMAVTAMGKESDLQFASYENPFIDVPEDHSYINAIKYASANGLLGNDLGKFCQPDIPLTMEFAAMIGVNMTGRDIMLGKKNTYLSLAISAHMFDGTQTYGKSQISRGGALMVIKNILEMPLVTYGSISSNGEKGDIRVEEDANLISSMLKYKKRRGILTSDGLTTVYGKNPDDGCVTVDGKMYYLLFESAVGMAGKMVEYYITEYEGRDAIKYMCEYRNTVMTVDSESINGEFDPVSLSYPVIIEGKTTNVRIKRNAYVSFNHEPYYTPSDMTPDRGSITFIDHNGDKVYDSVLILEFTNTIVDYYSEYAETIFDVDSRLSESIRVDDIDMSDAKNMFLTDTKNNFIEPNSLEKNSIISVYKSADGKKIRLIVSNEKVVGSFTSMDDEDNITIGDREYRLSKDFRSAKSEMRLGTDYTCYLDARGDVAYCTTDTGVMAYLINAGEKGVINKTVEIKALDEQSGEISIYELAEKVVYRTPSEEKKYKAEELYPKLFDNGKFKHGMFLIKFNADGDISSIIKAMEIDTYQKVFTSPDYPLYDLSYLAKSRPDSIDPDSTSIEYKTAGDHFSRWIVMGSGAKTFYLPPLKEGTTDFEDAYDEESIMIKQDSFANGDTETYNSYYTKDLNDVTVRYMLKYAKASTSPMVGGSPFLVTDIRGICNDEMGDCYRVTLEGTKKVTLYTKDLSVIEKANFAPETLQDTITEKERLEKGDLVIYGTDAAGKITEFLLLWDSRNNLNNLNEPRFGKSTVAFTYPWDNTDLAWKSNVPIGGLIKRKTGSALEIAIDEETSIETDENKRIQRISWGKEMTTYIVTFEGRIPTITKNASANELIPGDRIVLGGYNDSGQCYVAFVYRR